MKKIFYLFMVLLLPMLSISKDFKGAELRTKTAYVYGRFEAKIKSAHREGMLSSFFTYHEISNLSEWNEIDIEILGRYLDIIQFNTITANQANHVRYQFVDFNPHLDFHVYAFEWTPSYVAWFIDGTEVYRQTGAHIQTLNRAQKIMMNIWIPEYPNWVGSWDPNVLPAFAYYDWVSYYSYTPGSSNYGTGNNFTHVWTDNFDSWDQSRWEKATHTWGGNNSDFIQENVIFKDGLMILCLTNSTNIGYVDLKGPSLLSARITDDKIIANFTEELDLISSETISNYIIPSVTITNVKLRADLKSVELTVSGFDYANTYNLIVMNVKDRAPIPNVMSARAVTIIKSKQLSFPIKINVSGGVSHAFLPDQEWSVNTEYGYLDGQVAHTSSSIQINGTDLDSIYRSERHGLAQYKIRVPNGNYRVILMTCENYFNQADARKFDVVIEKTHKMESIDIFAQVGKNTAYDLVFNNISVTDGILDIHFSALIDRPLINGIIVESISTGLLDEEYFPKSFKVFQNFPNPFNRTTKFRYEVSNRGQIQFNVYDILGNKVESKNFRTVESGLHEFTWEAVSKDDTQLCSGVYLYQFVVNDLAYVRKFVLLN
ncbi:MAG: family 16 glycosylhydrolase [Bacteroidetes bacterium]|nr:family 16 glycosylhydrolase [Bacteroidota bacterium]